jgi:hypothetical protein
VAKSPKINKIAHYWGHDKRHRGGHRAIGSPDSAVGVGDKGEAIAVTGEVIAMGFYWSENAFFGVDLACYFKYGVVTGECFALKFSFGKICRFRFFRNICP